MDQIKFVIDELNQPPFSNSLNLIAYDSLRSEQRLDLLIQVLNAIDPKVSLWNCFRKHLNLITSSSSAKPALSPCGKPRGDRHRHPRPAAHLQVHPTE